MNMTMRGEKENDIPARSLRPGMKIMIGEAEATIRNVTWLDGKDGIPLEFISDGERTAVAIRVEFENGTPRIFHPCELIMESSK